MAMWLSRFWVNDDLSHVLRRHEAEKLRSDSQLVTGHTRKIFIRGRLSHWQVVGRLVVFAHFLCIVIAVVLYIAREAHRSEPRPSFLLETL